MTETIKCIIPLGNSDMEELETHEERVEELRNVIQGLYDSGSALYDDYMAPEELSYEEPPVFGTECPDTLIEWAEEMEQRACADSWAIIQNSFPVLDTHDFSKIKESAYKLASAFAALAGNANDSVNELFLSPFGQFSPWPTEWDLEEIKKDPGNWAICWIKFHSVSM